MTAVRGMYVRTTGADPNKVGTTPVEARMALAALFAETTPQIPRSGLITKTTNNIVTGEDGMSYAVAACNPVINRATYEGVYVFSLTGSTSVATTVAPGSGSRYDLIYVKQNDPDKGDPTNLPVLGVVAGVAAAGTPTKPYASVPDGGLVLAEALVLAGATATNGASVSITQVWLHAGLKGSPIRVRNQAERDAITSPVGGQVMRLDTQMVETWQGTGWSYGDTGWLAPTVFGNGFTPFVGNGYDGVRYRVYDDVVYLNGAANNDGTWTSSTAMFAIPAGLAPTRKHAFGSCTVLPDGNVLPAAGGTNAAVSFAAQWTLG